MPRPGPKAESFWNGGMHVQLGNIPNSFFNHPLPVCLMHIETPETGLLRIKAPWSSSESSAAAMRITADRAGRSLLSGYRKAELLCVVPKYAALLAGNPSFSA